MDVERLSVADVWRHAGSVAVGLGLARPGYHSVRKLVQVERARRIERREAIVGAVDEMWSFRATDYDKLAARLAETRRP
jgi:hypothetical protein